MQIQAINFDNQPWKTLKWHIESSMTKHLHHVVLDANKLAMNSSSLVVMKSQP
jgi:hypothetical protein